MVEVLRGSFVKNANESGYWATQHQGLALPVYDHGTFCVHRVYESLAVEIRLGFSGKAIERDTVVRWSLLHPGEATASREKKYGDVTGYAEGV